MLELYSNRELNLHVYLVVEMEGIISTLYGTIYDILLIGIGKYSYFICCQSVRVQD